MPIEVKIPAVGESITSGIVSAWHKESGEFVNEGDPLLTLETDKVSTEIVAEKAGVLETKVPEGQEVKIGEVVATIDDSKTVPAEKKKEPQKVEAKAPPPQKERSTTAETLSPAVRRIVDEEHLALEKIEGSGKGGRLTKGDVLAAAQDRKSVAPPVGEADSFPGKPTASPTAAEPPDPQSPDNRFIRKKIAPFGRKICLAP